MPYFVTSVATRFIDCGWNTDDAHSALTDQLNELGASYLDIETSS
jgi:hypothetical protein